MQNRTETLMEFTKNGCHFQDPSSEREGAGINVLHQTETLFTYPEMPAVLDGGEPHAFFLTADVESVEAVGDPDLTFSTEDSAEIGLPAGFPFKDVKSPLEGRKWGRHVVFGRLGVRELTVRSLAGTGSGFKDLTELASPQFARVGEIADQIQGTDGLFGFPPETLTEGSLYIPYGLEVHPAAQGQQLGLMLLAFAVRNLMTCSGDLMMGVAEARENTFTQGIGLSSKGPETTEDLVAYCERLGFQSLSDAGDIGPPRAEGIVYWLGDWAQGE